MPADPCIQIAAAKPDPGPWTVANENGSQSPVVPIDPFGAHAKVGSSLFDAQQRLGTTSLALGTRRLASC